jgi:hypothetical protein
VACPQGVEGLVRAGLGETLGSPWIPLAIWACGRLQGVEGLCMAGPRKTLVHGHPLPCANVFLICKVLRKASEYSYVIFHEFVGFDIFLDHDIDWYELCLTLSPKDGYDASHFVWRNSKSVFMATNFHQNFEFGRNCLVGIRLSFRCD